MSEALNWRNCYETITFENIGLEKLIRFSREISAEMDMALCLVQQY